MTGHWKGSNRRDDLPRDWPDLCKAVKARAGNRCEKKDDNGIRCGNVGTDVDHRVNRMDHRIRSLQLLCPDHHKEKTQEEARLGAAKAREKLSHPSTRLKHPGLL